MRKIVKISMVIILGLLTLVSLVNLTIVFSTSSKVFSDPADITGTKVALVLGTSSRTKTGDQNPFFETRMDKAAELYKLGKVEHVLVSGDNRTQYYNEPETMRKALEERGVDPKDITLDYAGFRTLDSVVRSKEVFGVTQCVIITQKFHSYRALYISDYYGLEASVLTTNSIENYNTTQVQIREYFARFKAFLDLYVLGTEPTFLGEKETLSN